MCFTCRLKYVGRLRRSFEYEFGTAIASDIDLLVLAYVLVAVYLGANLGKRDAVHSMCVMALACLAAVAASYTSSKGIGSYSGVKHNSLHYNIPFLILGLGVDDAFVLSAEYLRHSQASRGASVEERISLTAKTVVCQSLSLP